MKMGIRTSVLICLASLLSSAATHSEDLFQSAIPIADSNTLNKAKALRLEKKFKEAIPILENLTQRSPNFYQAQYNLALAYADSGDFTKAIPHFTQAASLQKSENISDPALFNSFGWMYLLKGDYNAAESQFKLAEQNFDKLAPDSKRKLLNNTGLLYLYKEDYSKAKGYLTRAATEFDSKLAKENLGTLDRLVQQKK